MGNILEMIWKYMQDQCKTNAKPMQTNAKPMQTNANQCKTNANQCKELRASIGSPSKGVAGLNREPFKGLAGNIFGICFDMLLDNP